MKQYFTLSILLISSFLFSCKSTIKQQEDKIYSRHLQRHVPLTIITTPMPDKKEEMNLLLFNNSNLLKEMRIKKIIDSLYKNDLIQPLILVAFDGQKEDLGLEETGTPAAKQHKQFNDFVADELYPYAKKKAVLRKFNSVAICGIGSSAANAFDIAWNNDNKIPMAGMFYPEFRESAAVNDSVALSFIKLSRKRPAIKIWLTEDETAQGAGSFASIITEKKSVSEFKKVSLTSDHRGKNQLPSVQNFADFLIWAFPK